ncbi:hypothetical protein FJO69_02230 [[Mycoplasma] falconis]|uniref:Uncharacterized protein n=1 Tax=[Mycoplasma] falconis TaxID=92403 RepID=A0A501X9V1_9BACT|nr:hypothetical protein [[Mycoplasma] falconis]TPE57209.1 hypothetical protein FJO69_02230 [[Mycoplasma] falconis]
MAETKKPSTLQRFYISEFFDKERNVSFNLKKANVKKLTNFSEFVDAVQEFVNIAEQSNKKSKCWFHRDGAFRGCVDVDGARRILGIFKENKVENKDAIEYLEKENLVEKPAAKAKKEVNLDEEALKVAFVVDKAASKKANEVKKEDIQAISKYKVTIESIVPNGSELDVYYFISNGDKRSDVVMSKLEGFGTECACAPVVETPVRYHNHRKDRTFWTLLSLLVVLIVINIILIILRAQGIL